MRQRGALSLIEAVLTLAVFAVITLLALHYYRTVQIRQNVDTAAQQVSALYQGTLAYMKSGQWQGTLETSMQAINGTDMINGGFIAGSDLYNVWSQGKPNQIDVWVKNSTTPTLRITLWGVPPKACEMLTAHLAQTINTTEGEAVAQGQCNCTATGSEACVNVDYIIG